MKTQQLILYRIRNKGLEVLLEKRSRNVHRIAWQLPTISWEVEHSDFCQSLQDNLIQLEYANTSYPFFEKYLAIEQSNDLYFFMKKKSLEPIYVRNGIFLSIKEVLVKIVCKRQKFFIEEVSKIVSERNILLCL